MICGLCTQSFNSEQQSPACPHLNLDPPKPRPGGPRLRPEIQRELDDAFNLRNRDSLIAVCATSLNFAARYYAGLLLARLDAIDNEEKMRSNLTEENS